MAVRCDRLRVVEGVSSPRRRPPRLVFRCVPQAPGRTQIISTPTFTLSARTPFQMHPYEKPKTSLDLPDLGRLHRGEQLRWDSRFNMCRPSIGLSAEIHGFRTANRTRWLPQS